MFLQNQKILNLCLRWHIFWGYCSVVEVTFNEPNVNHISALYENHYDTTMKMARETSFSLISMPSTKEAQFFRFDVAVTL